VVGGPGTLPVAVGRENAVQVLSRPLQVGLVAIAVWTRCSGIVPQAVAGAVGIRPDAVAREPVLPEPRKPSPAGTAAPRPGLVPGDVAGEPGQRAAVKENALPGIGSSNARVRATSPI